MRDEFLSHADAALLNRHNVLHYIKNHGPVSRTDIWGAMNISRASVTQVIRQLQEEDLVVEVGKQESSGGRMPRALCLNGNARFMYVLEWWGRKLSLVNLGGEILESVDLKFPANCLPTAFAEIVLKGVQRLEKIRSVPKEKLLGLGIVMPGQIDSRHTTVLYSVEMGWRDVDMHYLFSNRFGDDIFLENVGNMIALGEYVFEWGKDHQHLLVALLENEGIGSATVVRGNCQHGSNYMFGELGHIKLPSDVLCSCGQKGCLEAIIRDHMMRNGGVLDDELLEYLSIGVSTAVNLSDPGIVLLIGKLVSGLTTEQEKSLITRIRKKITNERSRSLEILVRRDQIQMAVKGMCAFIFNRKFYI